MELLAAAYASCVCGTIAYMLEKAGHHPDELETAAEVDMQPGEGVTGIRAVVSGVVPGVSPDDFAAIVTRAKDGCPVGRALTGTKVTLAVELH
jgi:osmotically inducible protein OsmC